MNAKELAEIAQANKKVEIPNTAYNKYMDELETGTVNKLNSLNEKFNEYAKQGYTGVRIKLDCTTDLFGVKENESNFYSEDSVIENLKELGFHITIEEDFYDARIYLVLWDDDEYASNDIIPMSI